MEQKKVAWVLESGVFGNDADEKFQSALLQSGMFFVETQVYERGVVPAVSGFSKNTPVVVRCSLGSARRLSESDVCSSGFFFGPYADFISVARNIPDTVMLNHPWISASVSVLKRDPLYFHHAFRSEHVFLRPNSGMKYFAGRLVHSLEVSPLIHSLSCSEDELIIGCAPNVPSEEYRCFVLDGKIVTSSIYMKSGETFEEGVIPEEGRKFTEEVVSHYLPDDIFVVDVCRDKNNTWKIMEYNCFATSGVYASHDVEALCRAVSDLSADRYEELYSL